MANSVNLSELLIGQVFVFSATEYQLFQSLYLGKSSMKWICPFTALKQ
jgi:hypothetical protein